MDDKNEGGQVAEYENRDCLLKKINKQYFSSDDFKKLLIKVCDLAVIICVVFLMLQSLYLLVEYRATSTQYAHRLEMAYDYLRWTCMHGVGFFAVSFFLKTQFFFKQNKKVTVLQLIKAYPEILCLIIAFLFSVGSTLSVPASNLAWNGNEYNHEGLKAVMLYGLCFIMAYSMKSHRAKEIILLSFLAVATIIASVSVLCKLYGAFVGFDANRMIFNNSNHYGYYTCTAAMISAGLLLYSKKFVHTVIYSIVFCINNLSVFISSTEGSTLGVLLGVVFLIATYFITGRRFIYDKTEQGVYKYNFNVLLLPILYLFILIFAEVAHISTFLTNILNTFRQAGVVAGGSASAETLGSGRVTLWKTAWETMIAAPWTGKGIDVYYGNVDSAIIEKVAAALGKTVSQTTGTYDMPHNEYLQIASNVGLVPLLGYVAAIMIIFVRGLLTRKQLTGLQLVLLSAAFGYCVSAFFGNTFTYTYHYFIIILGLAAPSYSQYKNKTCYAAEYATVECYQPNSLAYKAVERARGEKSLVDGEVSESTFIAVEKETGKRPRFLWLTKAQPKASDKPADEVTAVTAAKSAEPTATQSESGEAEVADDKKKSNVGKSNSNTHEYVEKVIRDSKKKK